MNRGVNLAMAAGLVAALTTCGDDAPDQALQAERAAALAADNRAGTTMPAEPESSATPGPAGTDPVVTVAPNGVVVPVIALDNSFRPEQLTIQVGDEVLWENNGRNEHNVLNIESADEGFEADGAWGIDVEAFQPGDVFSHVFMKPGTYRYYCTIHGNTEVGMVGTIIVEA